MNASDAEIRVRITHDRPGRPRSTGIAADIGRWIYARWIQAIACGDLLGRDQRPSQSKLAAFTVVNVGCACALWQVTHGGAVGGSVVTIVIAGLSASFGMKMFQLFLSRAAITQSVTESNARTEARSDTRQETKTHQITETIERKIVEDPDGDYEKTP